MRPGCLRDFGRADLLGAARHQDRSLRTFNLQSLLGRLKKAQFSVFSNPFLNFADGVICLAFTVDVFAQEHTRLTRVFSSVLAEDLNDL